MLSTKENALVDALLSTADFQSMVDIAEDILGTPIVLMDSIFNELSSSKGYPPDDFADYINRRQHMNDAAFAKALENVRATLMAGTPFIAEFAYMRRARMLCGCIVAGRLVGALRIPEMDSPLQDMDQEKVLDIARLLGMAIIVNGLPHRDETGATNLLWGLLHGNMAHTYLENKLIKDVFPGIDRFRVAWHMSRSSEMEIRSKIDRILPDKQWTIGFNNGYVTLFADQGRDASDFHDQTRRQDLLLGISDVFSQVSDVQEYLLQARAAHYFALHHAMETGAAFFDDYKIDYMLAVASSRSKMGGIRNVLRAISAYDEKNHTDYFNTLRAYLIKNQRAAEAAKALHIHKNTVFYRIGRIRELFAIDFTDMRSLTALYNSFLILDMQSILPDMEKTILV